MKISLSLHFGLIYISRMIKKAAKLSETGLVDYNSILKCIYNSMNLWIYSKCTRMSQQRFSKLISIDFMKRWWSEEKKKKSNMLHSFQFVPATHIYDYT